MDVMDGASLAIVETDMVMDFIRTDRAIDSVMEWYSVCAEGRQM